MAGQDRQLRSDTATQRHKQISRCDAVTQLHKVFHLVAVTQLRSCIRSSPYHCITVTSAIFKLRKTKGIIIILYI